tara:strand:- start:1953 stop:2393 length:441 start_codon:yes stop_codon:yes gene_type:complete
MLELKKVKTVTIGGHETEYDVTYVGSYVTAIIDRQASHYSEYKSGELPDRAVKNIYVEGVLVAELIGNKLYQLISGKGDCYDAYVDRQEPKEELRTDRDLRRIELDELDEFYPDEGQTICLKNVTAPPPYWTTDNSAGNIDIIYTN